MKDKIYIVCNSSYTQALKKIPNFKLNLGMSLSDMNNKVNTQDVIVQKHHMHHTEIVQMLGFLGSLPVYSHPSYQTNKISVCCDDKKMDHLMTSDDIYNELNVALDKMFTSLGLNKPVEKEQISVEIPVYVVPNKSLKDMTDAERLAYARNLK